MLTKFIVGRRSGHPPHPNPLPIKGEGTGAALALVIVLASCSALAAPTAINKLSQKLADTISSETADAHALALASASVLVTPNVTPNTPEQKPFKLMGPITWAKLPALPAAIAAGDLDGDGKKELAVLTDDEVLLFSADGKLFSRRDL